MELILAPCLQAVRSDTESNQKKRSPPLTTNRSLTRNAFFTTTCVRGMRADTSISASRNTKDRLQSGITLNNSMEES